MNLKTVYKLSLFWLFPIFCDSFFSVPKIFSFSGHPVRALKRAFDQFAMGENSVVYATFSVTSRLQERRVPYKSLSRGLSRGLHA